MTSTPSKGTTIAAAILAVLGALFGTFAAISNYTSIGSSDTEIAVPDWLLWFQAVALTIEVFTLGGGAAALFMRKTVGRWLVTAGCAIHVIQGIVAMIGIANMTSQANMHGRDQALALGGGVFGLVIALLPAIATLILVLLPHTGRWLSWSTPQQQGIPR